MADLALFDLTGKTALVTGGATGIGLGLAEGLARAGARLILNGRRRDVLDSAVEALRAKGYNVAGAAFDAADPQAVDQAITQLAAAGHQIDILVNNAGTNRRGAMNQISVDDYAAVIRANVDTAFIMSRAVSPAMIGRGSGKIINICSALSKLGRKNAVAYAASKGAIAQMTSAMCDELGGHGIQVNGIAPGYFLTELTQVIKDDPQHNDWLMKRTPAARWGEVEDLAGAAVFLGSRASDFVNGHILYVDGGLTSVMG
ncbi:SDR family oxidoreductase [Paracoccus homiensis]|uniref:Gluconate 5-dehydrogenase n=1 Tax=Paracoccus homiensis TaxID=364199 RepID=A0A1I0JH77_9RHOB|nr:SDR family oxidoreductase [Paracoccus homiensis]SEU08642.1 gluconate 5-dehydrogenase [Paracoccus homiensis]